MPLHLRALVVIMVLSLATLWWARKFVAVGDRAISPQDFRLRAMSWIVITLLCFLTHNYWVFALLSVPFLVVYGGRDSNRLSFYFFLLFAVPPFLVEVPGFGIFERLLELDHLRWMALAVLLPAFIALKSRPDVPKLGSTVVDKFILAYIGLWFMLQLTTSGTTITNLGRIVVLLFLDVFLPYYVASRALRNLQDFRDALMSLVIAIGILAPLSMFEFSRRWLLYNAVEVALGQPLWGFGTFLERGEGGALRALVSVGHPIVLGYLVVVALGLMMFLKRSILNDLQWKIVWLVLFGGMLASVSRGPWVGCAAMFAMFLLTGPNITSKLGKAIVAGIVLVPIALTTEQGQKMLDYLPFIGTVESRNVDFRQRLIEVSLGVLAHFPWFGALDYLQHPDMQVMRGEDGIIDVVNTYLGVAMATGVVGLTIFVAPFLVVLVDLARTLNRMTDKTSDVHLLGRTFLAVLVGTLVTIGTVAAILTVPVVYLTLLGMSAGYLQRVKAGALADEEGGAPLSRFEPDPVYVPEWAIRNRRFRRPRG